jgi:hypothetical protein
MFEVLEAEVRNVRAVLYKVRLQVLNFIGVPHVVD